MKPPPHPHGNNTIEEPKEKSCLGRIGRSTWTAGEECKMSPPQQKRGERVEWVTNDATTSPAPQTQQ